MPLEIANQRFGALIAIRREGKRYGRFVWLCRCDCGKEKLVGINALTTGNTRSCGCKKQEYIAAKRKTHGLSNLVEARTLESIRARCTNPNITGYELYGGRGITLCPRWDVGEDGKSGIECFLEDVGRRPSPEHSIDRIDVDGNYEPGNVRWATVLEQANNKRNTRYVVYRGTRMALCDAVRLAGSIIHHEAAWIRISRSRWTVEDAVETPRKHLSPNAKARRCSGLMYARRAA